MPTNITPPSFILPPKRSPNDMTPETVQRNRRMAEALMGSAIDTSPVGHWTQAIARVIDLVELLAIADNDSIPLKPCADGGSGGFTEPCR
jgi:hypothetical protein